MTQSKNTGRTVVGKHVGEVLTPDSAYFNGLSALEMRMALGREIETSVKPSKVEAHKFLKPPTKKEFGEEAAYICGVGENPYTDKMHNVWFGVRYGKNQAQFINSSKKYLPSDLRLIIDLTKKSIWYHLSHEILKYGTFHRWYLDTRIDKVADVLLSASNAELNLAGISRQSIQDELDAIQKFTSHRLPCLPQQKIKITLMADRISTVKLPLSANCATEKHNEVLRHEASLKLSMQNYRRDLFYSNNFARIMFCKAKIRSGAHLNGFFGQCYNGLKLGYSLTSSQEQTLDAIMLKELPSELFNSMTRTSTNPELALAQLELIEKAMDSAYKHGASEMYLDSFVGIRVALEAGHPINPLFNEKINTLLRWFPGSKKPVIPVR